ncbi:MAG TPA: SRPBCC family protein [Pseudonocardiaceae bacterium]|nr:SRPBCC family protein [Pseudonocardiaceae bacterium]
MTDPSTGTFVYVTHIAASPAEVWEALLNPEFTRRFWQGRVMDSDWRVGSKITFRLVDDDLVESTGTVLTADAQRTLSFVTTDHDGRDSTVTFDLVANGDVVALTVTHTGLDTASSMFRLVSNGWSLVMCNLKTLLETGRILPMPESLPFAYR